MKKTIKKLLCVVLVASFVFALAGCAKIDYETEQSKQLKRFRTALIKTAVQMHLPKEIRSPK